MNALKFLIEIAFDLFLMVVMLRFWLQLVKADFYNPLSQFVVKATSPLVNPLRRIVPGFGGLDLASLLLAYLVAFAKVSVVMLVFYGVWHASNAFIGGLLTLLKEAFNMVFWVLIIRAIMSWFIQGYHPIAAVFSQLTEPMLAPIRRVIPPLGGLDLSILILIVGLQFVQILLMDIMRF